MNSLKLTLFQLFLKDFQRANKFQIVCVRLILEKVGVNRYTRSQREIEIGYEFDFSLIITALKSRWRLLQLFLSE